MFQKQPFCFMMRQFPLNMIPKISILGWVAYLWFFNVILFLWVPPVFVTSVANYLFQSTASRHLWGLLCSQTLWNKSIQGKDFFFFLQNVLLHCILTEVPSKPNEHLPKETVFWFCVLLKIRHSQSLIKSCASSFPLAMITCNTYQPLKNNRPFWD